MKKMQLFSPQFEEPYFGTTKKRFKNDLKVLKQFFFNDKQLTTLQRIKAFLAYN